MEIVSRKDARAAGLKRYFTGQPCKRGHVVERLTTNAGCVVCHWAYCRTQMRDRYRANPDPVRRAVLRYYGENKGKVSAYAKANRARITARERAWRASIPGLNAAYVAKRRTARISATPAWLTAEDHATMLCLYQNAAALSEVTGIDFDVDHIVPLSGETVCGLHVPWNLRVIAASKNRSKGNSLVQ